MANFVLGVVLVLGTPYFLARTGSEVLFGFVSQSANHAAVTGTPTMNAWGGVRTRVNQPCSPP